MSEKALTIKMRCRIKGLNEKQETGIENTKWLSLISKIIIIIPLLSFWQVAWQYVCVKNTSWAADCQTRFFIILAEVTIRQAKIQVCLMHVEILLSQKTELLILLPRRSTTLATLGWSWNFMLAQMTRNLYFLDTFRHPLPSYRLHATVFPVKSKNLRVFTASFINEWWPE